MDKRSLLSGVGLGLLGATIPSLGAADAPQKQPNVLFIAIDDLRPELECHGMNLMVIPSPESPQIHVISSVSPCLCGNFPSPVWDATD